MNKCHCDRPLADSGSDALNVAPSHIADSKDATKSEKAKPYALKTCPVSHEKLGEMGDPYVFTYKDRESKLCCKDCKKDFDKNPEKFVKKIEKAEKKTAKK